MMHTAWLYAAIMTIAMAMFVRYALVHRFIIVVIVKDQNGTPLDVWVCHFLVAPIAYSHDLLLSLLF